MQNLIFKLKQLSFKKIKPTIFLFFVFFLLPSNFVESLEESAKIQNKYCPIENIQKTFEESHPAENFIALYFSTSIEKYNPCSIGVSQIKIGENLVEQCDSVDIPAGSKVELHFSNIISSLGNILNCEEYKSFKYGLNYVDFSHFDSSKLTNIRWLLHECTSIKVLNLSNFNTPLIEDQKTIQGLLLSISPYIVDISGVDMSVLNKAEGVIYLVLYLKYINMKNSKHLEVFKENLEYLLNKGKKIIICQDPGEDIISHKNAKRICCNYVVNENKEGKCESTNYIILYFSKENEVVYTNGFNFNGIRNDISFIINGDETSEQLSPLEPLTIKAGSKLELYFSSPLESLENYFDCSLDKNANNIMSIDFSNFDFSKLNKISSLFKKCESLESINLPNSEIIYPEKDNSMFHFCPSLKPIDILSLNIEDLENYENKFYNQGKYEYSKMKNEEIIKNLQLEFQNYLNKDNLKKYCHKTYKSLTLNEQVLCHDCNNENHLCQSSNYIIVYYKNDIEDIIYGGDFKNSKRKGIDFIINNNSLHEASDIITIKAKTKIEIYFSHPISTLESFFDKKYDNRVENIVSVDMTHFDSSLVKSCKKMFHGCINLISVNLTNFKTPLLKTVNSMFSECISLKSVDLSNFNTSSLENIYNLFKNCTSLKILNLSGLDMKNIKYAKNSFADLISLEYINIWNISVNDYFQNIMKNTKIFKEKENLICCQNGYIIENDKAKKICCDYNDNTHLCQSSNFISVYYGESFQYKRRFGNIYRRDINFINNNGTSHTPEEKLNIKENSRIEIHFSFPISSLNNFFNKKYDQNVRKIVSIDFSNFKSLYVTDMSSLFFGCQSLKSIDFSNFNTSSVTNMNLLFYDCKKLEALYLYNFNTSSVINMDSMFSGCNELKLLDISFFNMANIKSANFMFNGVKSLKYINIYHLQNSYNNITNSFLNQLEGLIVCQKENIITNENSIKSCCYFNISTNKCEEYTNYIIIYYGEYTEYDTGFGNDYRNGIEFIINGGNNSKLKLNDKLVIYPGNKIEIYFSTSITNISNFFNSKFDINVKKITFIDLSHFNISLITDMNSVFNGCSSLQSIDLPNVKASLVTNMNSMFSGCSNLKYLDLSHFDTSLVTNMDFMFSGCDQLKFLDLNSFNMINVISANSMFKDINNLKYINFYYIQNPKGFNIGNDLNKLNGLTVCQKENFITNKNAINKCCYYNFNDETCEYTNYIIIFFGKDCNYSSGFKNDYRKNIEFIIKDESKNKLKDTDELIIHSGSKLEIYFLSPITSLQSFFDSNYDINVENIISIDLSQFDSSLVTDMSSAFLGCISLKSIDLNNINTSSAFKMDFMFFGCSSLESIDLSNFETSLVTNMNYMFSGCSSLKSIQISNFDTSSTISMNSIFSGCKSLEFLDISNFNMNKVICAKSMFHEIKNLKYINLFNVEDSNRHIIKSELNEIQDLKICQKKNNIFKNKNNSCNEFNNTNDSNYIIAYYGKETKYNKGFIINPKTDKINIFRTNISYIFIDNKNTKYNGTDKLNINSGSKIEIYFSFPVVSLEDFFNSYSDPNAVNIISIDLSNFDSSLLNNTEYMFNRCYSLESIDFSNFDTSLITTMNSMFSECSSLKSLDLSNFKTSLLTDISFMFYKCSSLKSINISNFDLSKVKNLQLTFAGCTALKILDISSFNMLENLKPNYMFDIFSEIQDLKYINLINYKNSIDFQDNIKNKLNTDLISFNNLTVSQRGNIITNTNIKNRGCQYNMKTDKCYYFNYMVVIYGKESNYKYGFTKNEFGNVIAFRNDLNYKIYIKDVEQNIYNTLIFPPNQEIIIEYLNPIKNLSHFFNFDYDKYAENIKSIDLSHIDASALLDIKYFCNGCSSLKSIDLSNLDATSLTNMESMFYECKNLRKINFTKFKTQSLKKINEIFYNCSSIRSIDLSSFNTSNVISMKNMFYGCSKINYLLLSNFDTTSVTDMYNMFAGCSHLIFLDISNFNMENIKCADDMFYKVKKLRYINLYNVKNSYQNITNSPLNKLNRLTVCQRQTDKIITNDNAINKCCYFQISMNCENYNYILIQFGKEAQYNYGFISDTYRGYQFRKGIEFIILGLLQRKIFGTNKLYIPKGAIVEIYFSSNIKSLQNFFNANYDYNMENIISIDFSHFDSSLVTDMSSAFLGCKSLKSIDLSNFNANLVNNMKFMFFGCSSLESIDLSNFETSLVTNMNYIFSGCSSLKSINFSNFDTSNLTNIAKMFDEKKSLISIYLSNNDTLKILNISEIIENITSTHNMGKTNENIYDISFNDTNENLSIFHNNEITIKNETIITITENYTEINDNPSIFIITEQTKDSSLDEHFDSVKTISYRFDNIEDSIRTKNINTSSTPNNSEYSINIENTNNPSNICNIEQDNFFSKINFPMTLIKDNITQFNIRLKNQTDNTSSFPIKNNITYKEENTLKATQNIINDEQIMISNSTSVKITTIEIKLDKYFFPEINIELNITIPLILTVALKNINLAPETFILLLGFNQIKKYSSVFYCYFYIFFSSLKNFISSIIKFPLSAVYYIIIRILKNHKEFEPDYKQK